MADKPVSLARYRHLIEVECDAVKQLLIEKNKEYGASVFHPIGVFSAAVAQDQIDVRIDDKLKRIQTVRTLDETKVHEDTELDLIGYLILKRVARKIEKTTNEAE